MATLVLGLLTLAAPPAIADQPLEANAANNFLDWTFKAEPKEYEPGEAPLTGIPDALGGSTSLNFTLSGEMGNKRVVKLRQKDFPPELENLRYLRDLASVSWRIHHSDPLTYPRFAVTLKAKQQIYMGQPVFYKKYETIRFIPKNQKLNPGEWDTVTVDFAGRGAKGSKFRHSGPLDDKEPVNPGTHQKHTISQWILAYGDLEIHSIQWAYGSKDNALTFTSYIDYLEVNGVTFDFEGAPLQPPGPPTDLVATAEDGQAAITFTAAEDNGTLVTRYEYQLESLDSANNWTEGDWTSTGGTETTLTLSGLTNGTDYRVGLRAVSNAGVGDESASVTFAPRRDNQSSIDLVVESGNPRGFSLSSWTAEYVKNRNNAGIADGLGGSASINASLTGEGGDRWGLFLKPDQYKTDVKAAEGDNYGGRKIDRLSDLTSLSYRTQHVGVDRGPRLGFQIARNSPAEDGRTVAQLNVVTSDMPQLGAGWNDVSIDFNETLFRSSYLAEAEGEQPESKTLSEWIREYGDRRINLIRWQTGSGSGATINATYVDQIEVNGVIYDFEGSPPVPPAAPTELVAAPGTAEAGITFSFVPGDPGDRPITHYEYSLDGEVTWTTLGAISGPPYQLVVTSGLNNGREYRLFLRAVSNSGVGESASLAFRPRADLVDVTLIVDGTETRGFYLSDASSQYIKDRDQAGIPDKNGGSSRSLNASLDNAGDVWRGEIRAEDLNAEGRVLQKLHDIETLSYDVWHDGTGNYPALSILVDRFDGLRPEALYLQVNEQPLAAANTWQRVTVDPATSLFKNNNKNNGNEVGAGLTYTLNEWIALYGDRTVNRIRWGGTGRVPAQTYLDFLEINGVTYDFEAVPPAVVAPPPEQLAAVAGDRQAEISFSAGDNTGATVLAYEYRLGSNGDWIYAGNTVTPFTVPNLTNGTSYSLVMRTLSEGLDDVILTSDASEPVSFVPVGLPSPPTNLSAVVGDRSAVINFTTTDPNNGAAISNYHISLDGSPFVALDPVDTTGPITITDLTNGQTYTVALKTETEVGLSDPSSSVTFTPLSGASAPDAPTNVVLTPGDRELSVSFTPGNDNGAPITNYAYQLDGGSWNALSPASTSTSFVITGLENGESYKVSVRAINAEGDGADSSPVTATLPRSQITIPTDENETVDLGIVPGSGSNCSIVSWGLVPAPALETNVTLAYANLLNFTLDNCDPLSSTGIVITLSQEPPPGGIPYAYIDGGWRAIEGASIAGQTLRYDSVDNGDIDAEPGLGKITNAVAIAVPSGKPEAPYDLVATPGDGTATITFTAGNDNGNEISNYLYSTNGVDYSPLDPEDAASPVVIPNLTNGDSVSVTLKARNNKGDSPASEPVLVTLSADCYDVSDWSVAAGTDGWVCQVDGQEYQYADFHIFTTNGADVCVEGSNQLPTDDNGGQGIFCSSDGDGTVHAIYDWNNAGEGGQASNQLTWLTSVEQIGSRSGSCSNDSKTVADRCANQLASGVGAFRGIGGVGGQGIRSLDASNLTNLSYVFADSTTFNDDLSNWDISNVVTLKGAFQGAASFNQSIAAWDLINATSIENMFKDAAAFNNGEVAGASSQPLNWQTPNLLKMNDTFARAIAFNQQIFASTGSTAKVNNMAGMFRGATSFDQDIGAWSTERVVKTALMFAGATAFDRDLSAWNTTAVTDMSGMFKNAQAFDQDLSDWDITAVDDYSGFDDGANDWCGLGATNRGRPGDWSPAKADGCLNVVLQAPQSGTVGDEIDYIVQYYNESTSPFVSGVLTLDLAPGVSIVDAGDGAVSGAQITWPEIEVPAGTSAGGGGGELRVRAQIDSGVADGTELLASATLSDDVATSINDVAGTIVSAKSVLITTLAAVDAVVPGEIIEYSLSVANEGQSPTEGGEVVLTWEGDVPFTIEGAGGAVCDEGSSCRWSGDLAPADRRSQTVQLRIGADAAANETLTATLSASATNEIDGPASNASVTSRILALPLPGLNVEVATQPAAVVDVGAQFTAFVDLGNTGSGVAGLTSVSLDIGSATYVGPGVGDTGSYANNVVTWQVDDLQPSELKSLSATLRAPEAVGAVSLTAEVNTTAGGEVISDSAAQTLSVTGTAVLDLQLSLDPEEQLLPGDELDMAFGFQNIGNADALDVVLATETPVDTTLLAWPDYARCAGDVCFEGYSGAMSLDLGTVTAKENAAANILVRLSEAAQEQTMVVSGSLAGTTPEGDALVPQAAFANILVAAITDEVLTVSQRADRQLAAPGQVVVYEITYQNIGSELVRNLTLTDVLPKDTRMLNQAGGTVTVDPDTQETTWQLAIDLLAPLETGKVLLQVEVVGNAVTGTSLNNVVSLSTVDSIVWADLAEVAVVDNAPMLESSISNPESTVPGGSFIYALEFANTGTLDAGGSTLQMRVDDGITVTDCDGCSAIDSGQLTWSLGSVPAGTNQTKHIAVQVNANVPVNTELNAISYIGEAQSPRGSAAGVGESLQAQQQRRRGTSVKATQETSAAERAGPFGLSVIRVDERSSPALGGLTMTVPDQVVAGDQVAVTVSFENMGDAPATSVQLTSTVPSGAAVARIEDGVCSADPCAAGETVTWSIGDVATDSSREVSYVLLVDDTAAGTTIAHRVVLDSAESRPEIYSTTTDVVAEKLTLSITVQDAAGDDAEGRYVNVGDTLVYTLALLNDSPAARSGITVVNQLPPVIVACGQACITGDSRGAAIDAEEGTLTWSNFELEPGAGVTLAYQVSIPAGATNNAELVNSVNVSTGSGFYDSDLATVVIAAQADLTLDLVAPAVLQDRAQGTLELSYQNTGSAGTEATLRYVLPGSATMVDSANATVDGSTYTWALGDVAAGEVGSRLITIEAGGAADDRLLHSATVIGVDTSAAAEAVTIIGVREALDLSVTAPSTVATDGLFTTSLTVRNTGNAPSNAISLSLALPAGFTANSLDGGSTDDQLLRWTLDLPAGASVTLSPTLVAPSPAGNAVLLAGLSAASGLAQSASASLQVTAAPAAIIQAGVQFDVAESQAGDSVTLTAGPVNIGGAPSDVINNAVVLAAGLTATAFEGASWDADARVLSWTTAFLTPGNSDLKSFTVHVEDAGPLTATVTSNGAEGQAAMVRTFPEGITITPEAAGSSCTLSGQPTVVPAPEPPEGVTTAFPNVVGFRVIDCDRNPNALYPETLTVTIDVGKDIDPAAKLYKVTDAGQWSLIESAVIGDQAVSYSITDDGDLDQDKLAGTLLDPVALAFPPGSAPPSGTRPVVPVPLPLWLLFALLGSVGWLGCRRLAMNKRVLPRNGPGFFVSK